VQVGTAEILLDQVRAMAQAAQALAVPLVLREYPDMVHNWHFHFRYLPAARAALDELAGFVRE
jgi:acetyl esterase/lipase